MRRIAVALALLTSASSYAQETLSNRLREVCEKYLAANRIVGMSVAVSNGSELLLSDGFGLSDRSSGQRADSKTLFRLASISKPITAVGLLRLVDQGKVDLGAPVQQYVPSFPDKGSPITLKHILTHTSGIRHYVVGKVDNGFEEVPTDQAINKFKDDSLMTIPGEKLTYSTPAFTLLAKTIEATSGEPFVKYMRSEILPAAGDSLDYEVAAETKVNRSNLYILEPDAVVYFPKRENLSWKYAGGGMEGTAESVLRFCEAVRSGNLLRPETRDLMWTPTTYNDGSINRYGLGWVVREDGRVQHGGSQQGCASYFIFDPKTGAGAVVLANTQNAEVAKLAELLMTAVTTPSRPTRRR